MKTKPSKKALTFGDLIMNFYHTYGKRRAKGILRLVLKAHLVAFRGPDHCVLTRESRKP